jgi:hypothetical protein
MIVVKVKFKSSKLKNNRQGKLTRILELSSLMYFNISYAIFGDLNGLGDRLKTSLPMN